MSPMQETAAMREVMTETAPKFFDERKRPRQLEVSMGDR